MRELLYSAWIRKPLIPGSLTVTSDNVPESSPALSPLCRQRSLYQLCPGQLSSTTLAQPSPLHTTKSSLSSHPLSAVRNGSENG